MAKQSKVVANERRRRTVERQSGRRRALKQRIRDAPPGSSVQFAAVRELSRLPRDGSPTRVRRRDQVDGRPRGHLRRTGTSRVRFRELAHAGALPGIRKSSW